MKNKKEQKFTKQLQVKVDITSIPKNLKWKTMDQLLQKLEKGKKNNEK